jgi:hypothetical protein
MSDREQIMRSEEAVLHVFHNQFPALTGQIIKNLYLLSGLRERWQPILLVALGALLLLFTLLLRVGYFYRDLNGAQRVGELQPLEFITLIVVGSVLMFSGALFGLYQSRSLRKIILAQQVLGVQILNKQIDTEREVIERQQRQQQNAQLVLLPRKIRKRLRRC